MSSSESEEGSEPDTSPIPQSTIDSLPSVTIIDHSLLCAICTNQFCSVPETESVPETDNSVSLPCGHVYHSGCIVPWLHCRNSCLLCRCPLYLRRRRRPRDDVAMVDMDAEVERALSELSLRAAEAVAVGQALRVAARAMIRGERARRSTP